MAQIEKIRIQQALTQLVTAGPYFEVSYDKSTNQPATVDPDVASPLAPESVACNEVSSRGGADPRHGRAEVRQRTSWQWLAIVKFSKEVTAFQAEELWNDNPTVLARTSDQRQATIFWTGSSYRHGTRSGSHSGSQIEFNFEVRLSRR